MYIYIYIIYIYIYIEYYIKRICHKACQKLHAWSRIAKYIYEEKKMYAIQIFHNFTIQLLHNSLDVP